MKKNFNRLLLAITLCLISSNLIFVVSNITPKIKASSAQKRQTGYFKSSINQSSNSTLYQTIFASPKGKRTSSLTTYKDYSWNQSRSINTRSYLHIKNSRMMQSPILSSLENASKPTGSISAGSISTGRVTKSTAFQGQSFSSSSSSEPFSNNSTSIGTFSGPQYVAIGNPISNDYSPTTPLNHSTLALFSFLGLFFIYKKITEF